MTMHSNPYFKDDKNINVEELADRLDNPDAAYAEGASTPNHRLNNDISNAADALRAMVARIAALESQLAAATRRAEEAEQAEHKLDIEAERLAQENANLLSRAEEAEGAVKVLAEAGVQLRGALICDHMVQDSGEPFGTTKVALDQWNRDVLSNPVAAAALAATGRKEGE